MEIEEAKKLLAQDKTERLTKAQEELKTFLKEWGEKHGVSLVPAGEFIGNKFNVNLSVIAT